MLDIYIGWDSKENEAYRVCRRSIERRTSVPVNIVPLRQAALRYAGLYRRGSRLENGTLVDATDGKPYSTEFSFTRFLVPAMKQYEGWALFCDCDFLFRADVASLFELRDDRFAVMCVKHRHEPQETVKMDGCIQTRYRRKNWSSLMLFNCSKASNMALTPEAVSTRPGSWLHGFGWLDDEEIGSLPEEWNWLEGHSSPEISPKAVHFTRGGPWFVQWQNVAYASEWLAEKRLLDGLRGYR